jgi:hypothetical protein
VGGDILDYSDNVATSTADITTFKILLNITLSTEDATMMMMDKKKYYLDLNALAVDGWVYIEIRKFMYGLKQAGLLANQLLQTRLAPFRYYPARHTWTLAA